MVHRIKTTTAAHSLCDHIISRGCSGAKNGALGGLIVSGALTVKTLPIVGWIWGKDLFDRVLGYPPQEQVIAPSFYFPACTAVIGCATAVGAIAGAVYGVADALLRRKN